jgi:hypothetical protein
VGGAVMRAPICSASARVNPDRCAEVSTVAPLRVKSMPLPEYQVRSVKGGDEVQPVPQTPA